MSQEELLRKAWEALKEESSRPSGEGFQRLVNNGIIQENGEVIFTPQESKKKVNDKKTE